MRERFCYFLFLLSFIFATQSWAVPFCPSAPKDCNFSSLLNNHSELKSSRFLGLLGSAENDCKGYLAQPNTNSAGLKEGLQQMALDPRFTHYLTPQIAQCWKDNRAGPDKTQILARYAYLQKRFDNSASELVGYMAFADLVSGEKSLASISNCQAVAPELAETNKACTDLKKNCGQNRAASKELAKQFIADFNEPGTVDGKSIADLEKELNVLDQAFDKEACQRFVDERRKSGSSKAERKKTCADLANKRAANALRIQLFYNQYPWAKQDKFLSQIKGKAIEVKNLDLVEAALKAQVAKNAESVKKEFEQITDASRCLLRSSCSADDLNEAIKKTQAIPEEMSFSKQDTESETSGKKGLYALVSYNNCLDERSQDQRETSGQLWSASLGAAGAVFTMGGSLLVSGLTSGSRVLMSSAAVGSRLSAIGSHGIKLGTAIDGAMAGEAIQDAFAVCSDAGKSKKINHTSSNAGASCLAPNQSQREFIKAQNSCMTEMALALAGGGATALGAKVAIKGSKAAVSKPEGKELASGAGPIPDSSKVAPGAVGRQNDALSDSAVAAIKSGRKPSEVRSSVGKIDDGVDGGKSRLKVAREVVGRDLSDEEKNWIMAAHQKHDKGYRTDWTLKEMREKLENRPSSIDSPTTRKLMEFGVLGSENGQQMNRGLGAKADISLNQEQLNQADQIVYGPVNSVPQNIELQKAAIFTRFRQLENYAQTRSGYRLYSEISDHAAHIAVFNKDNMELRAEAKRIISASYDKIWKDLEKGDGAYRDSFYSPGSGEEPKVVVLRNYISNLKLAESKGTWRDLNQFKIEALEEHLKGLQNPQMADRGSVNWDKLKESVAKIKAEPVQDVKSELSGSRSNNSVLANGTSTGSKLENRPSGLTATKASVASSSAPFNSGSSATPNMGSSSVASVEMGQSLNSVKSALPVQSVNEPLVYNGSMSRSEFMRLSINLDEAKLKELEKVKTINYDAVQSLHQKGFTDREIAYLLQKELGKESGTVSVDFKQLDIIRSNEIQAQPFMGNIDGQLNAIKTASVTENEKKRKYLDMARKYLDLKDSVREDQVIAELTESLERFASAKSPITEQTSKMNDLTRPRESMTFQQIEVLETKRQLYVKECLNIIKLFQSMGYNYGSLRDTMTRLEKGKCK